MKPILCFGELLIDFLNFNTIIEANANLAEFRQYPGGAPANVAAAIGQLGGPARFLGQIGDDRFGRFLVESMKAFNVDTQYIHVHPTANTPLAFVFLDAEKERSFEFLRNNSADVLMTETQLTDAAFDGIGIFHFCSNTLTDTNIANTTKHAVLKAKAQGAVISFDVNLRHNLWPENEVDKTIIIELLKLADVIKVSREEGEWIEAAGFAIDEWLRTATLIWQTDAGNEIQVYHRDFRHSFSVFKADVIDSTAAGDAFSGGLLMAINEIGMDQIDQTNIKAVTDFGSRCGAHAVSRAGALPSLPSMQDVQAYWPFK